MSCTMVRRIREILLLCGMACLLGAPGWGGPLVATPYAKTTRTFKVCMLLLKSQTKPGAPNVTYWNSDPWIMPVVNRSPYKPAGWELENPLAPAVFTADAELINSGAGYAADGKGNGHNWYTNDGLAKGDPLTKDDPAYWVVKLDTVSLDALAEFDLLIVNGHNESTLNNEDRQYLRYLIDRGATIWVNNSQRMGMQLNNFFLDPPIRFRTDVGWYNDTNGWRLFKTDFDHWLVNGQYKLSDEEIFYLRDNISYKSFIEQGVAGFPPNTPSNSLIREVVRLYPAEGYPNGAPAIAAGPVGNGQLIVTGTDIIGAIADWWEYKHNRNGWNDLRVWPYHDSLHITGPAQVNDHRIYVSSAKFFYNILARPANWSMVSANPNATRAYPQAFSTTLAQGWRESFTALSDPVSADNYLAIAGYGNPQGASPLATELRVYRAKRVTDTNGRALDYPYGLRTQGGGVLTPTVLGVQPWWWNIPFDFTPNQAGETDLCLTFTAGYRWVGAPAFGEISQDLHDLWPADYAVGSIVTRRVMYALEEWRAGDYRLRCFALDPYIDGKAYEVGQAGSDLWAGNDYSYFSNANDILCRASLTCSNGRVVLTAFGKPTDDSPWRIFLIDGKTGTARIAVGAGADFNATFRLTGPASLVTSLLNFEASTMEAGTGSSMVTASSNNPMAPDLRQDAVELLTVTGEYYPASAAGATNGQTALFLIPPTLVGRLAGQRVPIVRIPPDLRLIVGSDPRGVEASTDPLVRQNIIPIGDPNSAFRKKYISSIKVSGSSLKITFRSWNVFFPQGSTTIPPLSLPLSLAFTPDQMSTATPQSGQRVIDPIYLENLRPTMGYPIALRGTRQFAANNIFTLHGFDGDADTPFGPAVDAPILIWRDQAIVGTNTAGGSVLPTLNNSAEPIQPRFMRLGGTLSGVRLTHGGFSVAGPPMSYLTNGDLAWQFHGDTMGPADSNKQHYFWRSNFPFPAAVGGESVFTTAMYHGYGAYYSYTDPDNGDNYASLNEQIGMLYALDPSPSQYLQQVVQVGAVAGANVDTPQSLLITLADGMRDAVRVGVRALLVAPGVNSWDMGRVVGIRGTAPDYELTFDRPWPTGAIGARLLISTSVPYVSQVRGWNRLSGADPVRQYTYTDGVAAPALATRVSEGMAVPPTAAEANGTTIPVPESANPDPRVGIQEVMIDLGDVSTVMRDLAIVSHIPGAATPALNGAGTVNVPNLQPFFNANDWRQLGHLYLPKLGPTDPIMQMPVQNFVADMRTGRIRLHPRVAGEFADRFVTVHYYTNDLVGDKTQKVLHAEVMYVPSQVKWQYRFVNAIPDSGPTVVHDTVYITALRKNANATWQPVLYAFAAKPQDPRRVQPLWVMPLSARTAVGQPYRGVTSALPTPAGLLVATGLPGAAANAGNEMTLFTDRGTLIADGHRVVRINGDSQVTWQASATVDYDPLALALGQNQAKTVGVTQQPFTLITRLRKLDNGNLLLCDTGENRVVEMDREGQTVWQYPDSDLTYQDPDTDTDGKPVRPNLTAIRKATEGANRLNGPRDVRRYVHDVPGRFTVSWPLLGVQLDAAIRWESTLIADAGNNRIIEVQRPLVSFANQRIADPGNANITLVYLAQGFHYRPDVLIAKNGQWVPLVQTVEVIADSATLISNHGTRPMFSFTQALRYSGSAGQFTSTITDADPVWSGYRTREVLAVVGNGVEDVHPTDRKLPVNRSISDGMLRTAWLRYDPATGIATLQQRHAGTSNALLMRVPDPNDLDMRKRDWRHDYARVWQFDLVPLQRLAANGTSSTEVHLLVVDEVGVREMRLDDDDSATASNLDQTANGRERSLLPPFEMSQDITKHPPVAVGMPDQYTMALTDDLWSYLVDDRYPYLIPGDRTPLKDKLDAWREKNTGKPALFAPVGVLRLDSGKGEIPAVTADAEAYQQSVRYLIAQMNTVANPDVTAWIDGAPTRRIHLFESRWVQSGGYWGILDDQLGYYVFPDPLSPDYPNLPGWTYPLSQPFGLERD